MELTGGADCGATGGDEKSERFEEEGAGGGSVRVERWVRPRRGLIFIGVLYLKAKAKSWLR
jgi:hypothetical protein